MNRMLAMLFGGLMVLGLVGVAQSAEPQRSDPAGPPGPERMFQRWDTNQDGRIVLDELPDSVPDSVKQMLKRADENEDGVVTREEFQAAVRQRGPRGDSEPQGRGRPPMGHGFEPAERSPRGERGRQPGTRPGAWDPQVWFDRMDRDKDGKLSPEEFAAGMRLFHRGMTRTGHPTAVAPRSPRGRQPWGPGWMAQPPRAFAPWGGGPWSGGHRGWQWGQPPMTPGRPGLGAGMSAEQRAEIAKHVQRARQEAEAAWKRAATMRDQMLKRWAQKQEAEADLKRDPDRAPRVEPKEPKAKKEADQRKKQPKQPKAKPTSD